jgi:hypothetical protein
MDTSDDRDPLAVEQAYLAALRERVAWQAEAADRLRRGLPVASDNVIGFPREASAADRLAEDAQAGPDEGA